MGVGVEIMAQLILSFEGGVLKLRPYPDVAQTATKDGEQAAPGGAARWPAGFPAAIQAAFGHQQSQCQRLVMPTGVGQDAHYELAACAYYDLIMWLREQKIVVFTAAGRSRVHPQAAALGCLDQARGYRSISLRWVRPISLRVHQQHAWDALRQGQGRGCVVLPTGAGKTLLACQMMAEVARSVMVVVPTLDLMEQWAQVVLEHFGLKAGLWGGGRRELADVTIITYDSALRVVGEHGHRFGLVIFDECHHLAAPTYQQIALKSLAPYRLGLTATMEREDGKETDLVSLVGPVVYHAGIQHMTAAVLSPYEVITWRVPLSDKDQRIYDHEREIYLKYIRRAGISFQHKNGWQQFVMTAARSAAGRRALSAYRQQRRIACNSHAKVVAIWRVITDNPQEKILIFTQDNELAYQIGLRYFLPVLTHHTKKAERRLWLDDFRRGKLRCLVTSKVLNEGVDVPDASVGVVVSGTGSVREHVQRLGRILRHRRGKTARLYELVSAQTGEINTQYRRRSHDAYQRTSAL